MKRRHEFLNHIIKLQWGNNPNVRYLEIGVRDGYTFRRVNAIHKVGVDPQGRPTYRMTSDKFFMLNKIDMKMKFDLVFVDGLHQREQAVRDVLNSIDILNPNGIVIMDDCLPQSESEQEFDNAPNGRKAWTGDVWKAVVDLRQDRTIDVCVVNVLHGMGVVLLRPARNLLGEMREPLTWQQYQEEKRQLLNLVSIDQMQRFLEGYGNV